MPPFQAWKFSKTTIGGDPLAIVFDSKSGKIGIGDIIDLCRRLPAKIDKNVPMARARIDWYAISDFDVA